MTTQKPTAPPATRDPAIHRLYAHLGPDTLLVEVPPGHPRFRLTVAGLPTLAESLTEAYQLGLAEGDVAVALGTASHGLCVLGFVNNPKMEAFLAGNPALRGACRVEHPGLTALLLRVDGAVPASRMDGDFVWLSDGSTLTVLMRTRRAWHAFPPGKPLVPVPRVRLAELEWRSLGDFGMAILRDVLKQEHGALFKSPAAGQGRLHLSCWSELASKLLPIRFHAQRRQFQQQDPSSQTWQDCPREVIGKTVHNLVWELTAKWHHPYAPTPSEVRRLVARLQVAVARHVPEERDYFRDCVASSLERAPGSNVTNPELFAVIERQHQKHGRPMPSITRAGRWMNESMAELFSAPNHRNLRRGIHWKRGFRGFRLRKVSKEEVR